MKIDLEDFVSIRFIAKGRRQHDNNLLGIYPNAFLFALSRRVVVNSRLYTLVGWP